MLSYLSLIIISILSFVPAYADITNFTIFDYPGASTTVANGINDLNQVVGGYNDGLKVHGFLKVDEFVKT